MHSPSAANTARWLSLPLLLLFLLVSLLVWLEHHQSQQLQRLLHPAASPCACEQQQTVHTAAPQWRVQCESSVESEAADASHSAASSLTAGAAAAGVAAAAAAADTAAASAPSSSSVLSLFNISHDCDLSQLPWPYSVSRLHAASPPYLLWLHPASQDRFISARIAAGGVWEAATQRKMRARLEQEEARLAALGLLGTVDARHGGVRRPLFVDVGANIGAHAMFVANLGFEVHAFEPMPHNMRLMRCSASSNARREEEGAAAAPQGTAASAAAGADSGSARPRRPYIRPVLNQVALGEAPFDPARPRVCMQAHGDNQGHSFITPDAPLNATGSATAVPGVSPAAAPCASYVPLSSLDEYDRLVLRQRRITYLKIDAEGFEAHILAGMSRLLSMRPPRHIYMEFAPQFLRSMGRDPEQLLWTLARQGYALNHVTPMDAESIERTLLKASKAPIDLWMTCVKTIFD